MNDTPATWSGRWTADDVAQAARVPAPRPAPRRVPRSAARPACGTVWDLTAAGRDAIADVPPAHDPGPVPEHEPADTVCPAAHPFPEALTSGVRAALARGDLDTAAELFARLDRHMAAGGAAPKEWTP